MWKTWLVRGGATFAILAALVGGYYWTISNGRTAVVEIARERGWCQTDLCEEGARVVYDFMQEERGVSSRLVDWCIGVDDWAETRVQRGGWIKSLLVEVMYWPCGSMFDE